MLLLKRGLLFCAITMGRLFRRRNGWASSIWTGKVVVILTLHLLPLLLVKWSARASGITASPIRMVYGLKMPNNARPWGSGLKMEGPFVGACGKLSLTQNVGPGISSIGPPMIKTG